ncbi:DUF115 domain-containing protein [Paenibacillus sp. p3-SID1389]|jgi:hypothetical protein|uniref:motility associated factor glycosyltransferase family protein n=1 Tax=Paenibacillus TaxID=44249 RepID=UPI0021A38EDE|nr:MULTISPECIES: 6-hydroxymethylpterin diphosphokinase MptE-like protein [Paenibacillus]MCT2195925.1 DUF115 domain-containing protein [Paenibacillus sp. p3-SID1389]MEC2346327.1 DUF115 domain-containing protein [Paenibacillus barengoltzii]
MSLYETNREYIAKEYPSLLSVFENEVKQTSRSMLTRNNEPNLELEKNNRIFCLHSRYNAREEARRWVQSIKEELAHAKHIFIIGIGLGYFLEELLSENQEKDIFILEPSSEVFIEWVKRRDVTNTLSNSRIRLVAVGNNEFLPLQISAEISRFISGELKIVVPPIYKKMYPELIEEYEIPLKEMLLKSASNIQTFKHYEKTWIANALYNLPSIIQNASISNLENIWKDSGARAIVVGSGPSLKKDIHLLNELKDKCLIIAAGSSIQALQSAGINPHFVVSIDGSEKNYKVFKNVDTTLFPLVYCPAIYYEIVENHKSEKYYAGFQGENVINYIMGEEFDAPKFLSTSTVTGTAIQIAWYMGIQQVILMGQDLSFTEDEYYAPGVIHYTKDEQTRNVSESNKWVKNVDGGQNRTKDSMEILRQDIVILVQIMKLRGVNVINTSKRGAVIEGTTWMAMEDLMPELLKLKSRDLTISHYIPQVERSQIINKKNLVITRLKEVLKKIDTIYTNLENISKRFNKLQKAISTRNQNSVTNEIVKINGSWTSITSEELFDKLYSYSLGHYINVYMRFVPEIVETQNMFTKGELIITHLGNLVNKMKDFTPDLQNIINTSIQRLESIDIN